ncbi:MAG: mandelate racemase/muconate lactonizing protein, partial [Rhodoferax sp.]|nr:mandelate racemase/muconate lactonizing protein [Rhodoferax sp.]
MATLITDIKVFLTATEGINLVVVKVETNQPGLYGLGCATFAYRHLVVQCLVEEYLKPLLVGRDATAIEEIWQLVHQNAYWRNGPVENNALSGIDMALWDIKGKMAGMPLYQLFGGKVREGVPIYRHADGRDVHELCDNIERYRAQGITHIRCQSGGYGGGFGAAPASAPAGAPPGIYLDSKKYMRDTLKMFDTIRSKIGFEVDLCHDVHERLKPIDAIRFAGQLEEFDLFFLEDAIPLEETGWMRQLREKTSIPLALGELFNNPAEWKFLITEQLIDYIRVHLSQIGGITPARKLQIFAEQFGVRTAWHGPGDMSPMAHAANIH